MVTQLQPGSVPATVTRVTETVLPTKHGVFQVIGYRDGTGTEHVALARGLGQDYRHSSEPRLPVPLVRVHSECLTGDAFGSWRCDCGEQLDTALSAVAAEGLGVVVYVRGHEGRGIGLLAKLKAYALQDQGVDTVDANTALGLPVDARRYDQAAEILQDLGISTIRLLSGNPAKEEALAALGVTVVERRGLPVVHRPENAGYLATKRARMRHDTAPLQDAWSALLDGEVPVAPARGMDEELAHRYGPLVSAPAPLVIGHARQSLDGFVLPPADSLSSSASGCAADLEHLRRLRALVDAVVVDAATITAADYSPGTGETAGRSPVRVVLDGTGMIGADAGVLTDDGLPTVWVVGTGATVPPLPASVEVVRLPAGRADQPDPQGVGLQGFDPSSVLGALRSLGLGKVLIEKGEILSGFLGAGLLHRLFLTTAPVLLGDGVPGIRFSGAAVPAEARNPPTRRFVLGQDICTEFDFTPGR